MKKLVLFFLFMTVSLFALSSHDLAVQNDKVMSGFEDSIADMQMTLINANGESRVRDLKMKTLEKDGGDMSLMEFISPADVEGTKFLNYEHIDKDDDQWLYLPALKRVKRIASSNKSGSFMGSEFSYEDLSSFNIDKYEYEGEAIEEMLDGVQVYKSVRIPKDENSGYTKQITYIQKDNLLVKKVDYFDRKKSLLKSAIFSDYKQIKDIWRIGKIEMSNFQNGKKTTLVWSKEDIKNSLDEKDFTKRELR